jgi:hypothetical protein
MKWVGVVGIRFGRDCGKSESLRIFLRPETDVELD